MRVTSLDRAGVVQVAWLQVPVAEAVGSPVADVVGARPARGPASVADDLLRYVVAQHLGVEASVVCTGRLCPRCGSAEHGRPVVIRPTGSGLHVSLSRAPGLVLVAATTLGPIGVDVEQHSAALFSAFPGFSEVALSTAERPVDPPYRATVWTRKEAAVKALGLGVSAIDQVDVGPADRTATNVSVRSTTGSADTVRLTDLSLTDLSLTDLSLTDLSLTDLSLTDLSLDDGYAAAVAVLAAVPAAVTIRHVSGAALWEVGEAPARTATPSPGR